MRLFLITTITLLLLLMYSGAEAHSVHYQVENKGISVRVFYSEDEPASYSAYEIFGPGDKIPHQKGRTDKNGFVSFLPDRKGNWVIKVYGESEHGMHGAQVVVDVNENLFMDSFKKTFGCKIYKILCWGKFYFRNIRDMGTFNEEKKGLTEIK